MPQRFRSAPSEPSSPARPYYLRLAIDSRPPARPAAQPDPARPAFRPKGPPRSAPCGPKLVCAMRAVEPSACVGSPSDRPAEIRGGFEPLRIYTRCLPTLTVLRIGRTPTWFPTGRLNSDRTRVRCSGWSRTGPAAPELPRWVTSRGARRALPGGADTFPFVSHLAHEETRGSPPSPAASQIASTGARCCSWL